MFRRVFRGPHIIHESFVINQNKSKVLAEDRDKSPKALSQVSFVKLVTGRVSLVRPLHSIAVTIIFPGNFQT